MYSLYSLKKFRTLWKDEKFLVSSEKSFTINFMSSSVVLKLPISCDNVIRGSLGDVIGLVISSGGRIDFVEHQGNNVLYIAMSTKVDLVQMLLVGHPNPKKLINARNDDGKSSLGLVMTQLKTEWLLMIQFSVNYGADVNEIDNEGNNLLHIILAKCDKDVDAGKTVVDDLAKL